VTEPTVEEQAAELQAVADKEEQAYLDAFNEANSETPAAKEESDEASVAPKEEDLPADKTPEPDDDSPSAKGTASDAEKTDDPDPYAWIDDLPEDQRARAKALQHAAVSDAGRVAALQRRAQDAEARLTAKQVTQAKSRAKAPDDSTAKPEDKELSPKLKEFVESYPQLAESVQEMVNQDRADLEQMIDERLQPFQEEATFKKVSEARNRLEEGASEIFDTPTTKVHYSDVLKSDLYKDTFLKSQPKEFQEMATTTADPDTALWVLKQFKTFAEQYAIDNNLMDEGNKSSAADKTREERNKRKASAGTPSPRSAVTDPEDSSDYETYFKKINS
jgi:hypothetical protein